MAKNRNRLDMRNARPIIQIFEVGGATCCEIHPSEHELCALVCFLVQNIAAGCGVAEDVVWHVVDLRRKEDWRPHLEMANYVKDGDGYRLADEQEPMGFVADVPLYPRRHKSTVN